jgi:hypothetical protein
VEDVGVDGGGDDVKRVILDEDGEDGSLLLEGNELPEGDCSGDSVIGCCFRYFTGEGPTRTGYWLLCCRRSLSENEWE